MCARSSSVTLALLRAIEETLIKGATHNLIVRTRAEVALYVLNQKRGHLRTLEERFRITMTITADATVVGDAGLHRSTAASRCTASKRRANSRLDRARPCRRWSIEDDAQIADEYAEEPAAPNRARAKTRVTKRKPIAPIKPNAARKASAMAPSGERDADVAAGADAAAAANTATNRLRPPLPARRRRRQASRPLTKRALPVTRSPGERFAQNGRKAAGPRTG